MELVKKMLEMFVIHEQVSFSSNKKIHSLRMKGYAQVTFKKLGYRYNQTGYFLSIQSFHFKRSYVHS